jgi:mannose-6-phosphate isomerase
VYEGNRIAEGPYADASLAEVVEKMPPELLGKKVLQQSGARFPLLIKLLDCADWLSLQVHPNDEQAKQLEGPDHFGKTEAWFVVEADDDAQLLGGFRAGVASSEIAVSLEKGGILDLVQRHDVRTGDAIFIPAGLIHALGPGLLVYEVQQTSDITYRVYDWDRPLTAGRKLHLDQARVALNPDLEGQLISGSSFEGKPRAGLVSCDYFSLELISGEEAAADFDTQGESFSVLTVLDGKALIHGDGWQSEVGRFESLLVPAACGEHRLEILETARVLRAFVP